ncbi:hypothetical protein [Pseudomonas lalucatii]|uniref:hypothetical protein n=1 Tax=Pseudomonas lalucatii TaxID=1424203 RepID=UPI003B84A945
MSSAFTRHPRACLLHALCLAASLLVAARLQLSPYAAVPLLLLAGLWPWLGPGAPLRVPPPRRARRPAVSPS